MWACRALRAGHPSRGDAAEPRVRFAKVRATFLNGFYEWHAIKGAKVEQPYPIAMKDRTPFGLAVWWENWKEPATGEWVRTFGVITVRRTRDERDPGPHTADPQAGGLRRLASGERNPAQLLKPFPSQPMTDNGESLSRRAEREGNRLR